MKPTIRTRNLSKLYRIGARLRTGEYSTLRESIMYAAAAPFRRLRELSRWGQVRDGKEGHQEANTVWALKDVSFDVQASEVVGIIGRNGAGKSTLLKILSRITEPTSGRVEYRGRVSSLLEIGTGFHFELTGRENVFLSGAILGMSRREISGKFDEIVAFAEIDQFLDTPVKRYSSGMTVRLAFAVAAHLEPEILIVDEVLAVGDVNFQRKCLGKMQNVATKGRTVLFVSHNMGTVASFCSRGIVLDSGRIVADTDVAQAIGIYLHDLEESAKIDLCQRTDRFGQGEIKLARIEMFSGEDLDSTMLKSGAPARFIFHLDTRFPDTICVFSIYDNFGHALVDFRSRSPGFEDQWDSEMGDKILCDIPELLLVPGRYRLDVEIHGDGRLQDRVEGAAYFDVLPGHIRGRQTNDPIRKAKVNFPHRWTLPT